MKKVFLVLIVAQLLSCSQEYNIVDSTGKSAVNINIDSPSLIILGTIQDAGSPQIGCKKDCCKELLLNPDPNRMVVSLGIIDPQNEERFIFEATPDMSRQVDLLNTYCNFQKESLADGVFLTHAHIGHYAGLMYFGKEATNANKIPVFAMHQMSSFLKENGPWSQLVSDSNILISELSDRKKIKLNSNFEVQPFSVPHRDEYSETVGYKIIGPNKTILFIPDINKWNVWENDIVEEIKRVDYAFLDATFFDAEEINNRDISEIPHPFIIESLETFKDLSEKEKAKIHFIHFNHTNPVIDGNSPQAKQVLDAGFNIAQFGQIIQL